jgi:hypothetical protein
MNDNTVAAPPSGRLERSKEVGLARIAAAVALALALSGCATQGGYLSTGLTQRDRDALGGKSYEVGPVTVLILPQPEVETICLLRGGKASSTARIHGCYVPGERLIVSTADPYVLLHEFKHHFEGAWHK